MAWIQIRTNILSVSPDLGPNCLQRLSADDKSHHLQVKIELNQYSYQFIRVAIHVNMLKKLNIRFNKVKINQTYFVRPISHLYM